MQKTPRPLFEIAKEIREAWPRVSPYAEPYLSAMEKLNFVNDNYGYDSGKSIVLYFLSNATSWRGEDARRIKNELKETLKPQDQ